MTFVNWDAVPVDLVRVVIVIVVAYCLFRLQSVLRRHAQLRLQVSDVHWNAGLSCWDVVDPGLCLRIVKSDDFTSNFVPSLRRQLDDLVSDSASLGRDERLALWRFLERQILSLDGAPQRAIHALFLSALSDSRLVIMVRSSDFMMVVRCISKRSSSALAVLAVWQM